MRVIVSKENDAVLSITLHRGTIDPGLILTSGWYLWVLLFSPIIETSRQLPSGIAPFSLHFGIINKSLPSKKFSCSLLK